MIEINLLPGTTTKGKSRGGGGGGVDFAGAAAGFVTKVKDPWLIGAVASLLVAGLIDGCRLLVAAEPDQ